MMVLAIFKGDFFGVFFFNRREDKLLPWLFYVSLTSR